MRDFSKMQVGDTATLSRSFNLPDLELFAQLSLDTNPVHFDDEFASQTIFGKQIVHGFLYASLISGILGTKLPGPGAIYLMQEMKFLKPVYLGDEIVAKVSVLEKDEARQIVTFETTCSKADGTLVLTGKAKVKC